MMKHKIEFLSMDEQNRRLAMRVSIVTIAGNIVLSLVKLLAGVMGHSAAMISDSIHSMSDVLSTFIVILGVNLASRKADAGHPYGYDRLECVAAIILSGILFATGAGIGIEGLRGVWEKTSSTAEIPGLIALLAAVISIVSKEWMYWYTRAAAKKIRSDALMADAWHHRSDAFSSIGAFIGILGARMGYLLLDPLANVVICFFIAKAAFDIFKDAVNKMIDTSCDAKTEEEMRTLILSQKGVIRLDILRTRLFGAKMYVDVEISADGSLPLSEGHAIAHRVHDQIETRFPMVKHCMVHVNPSETIRKKPLRNGRA